MQSTSGDVTSDHYVDDSGTVVVRLLKMAMSSFREGRSVAQGFTCW